MGIHKSRIAIRLIFTIALFIITEPTFAQAKVILKRAGDNLPVLSGVKGNHRLLEAGNRYDIATKDGSYIQNAILIKVTKDSIILKLDFSEKLIIIKKKDIKRKPVLVKRKTKKELPPKKIPKYKFWNFRQIGLWGTHLFTLQRHKENLPTSFGGAMYFDQGILNSFPKRSWWVPALRFQAGFLQYKKLNVKVGAPTIALGPVWHIPLFPNHQGKIFLAAISGISFLKIKIDRELIRSNTFTFNSALGYEYPLGKIKLFIMGNYFYIYDKIAPLVSIGYAMGVSYNFNKD